MLRWHGDTFNLPDATQNIAHSEACRNQVFVFGEKVVGLQFHLEMTEQGAKRIVENGGDELAAGDYIKILKTKAHFELIRSLTHALLVCLSERTKKK